MLAEDEAFWHASDSPLLARAVQSLAADGRVCAPVLRACQRQHGWSAATLAAWLTTTPTDLLRLALCQRPDPTAVNFPLVVHRLADYTGCDRGRLTELLSQPLP